MKKIILTIYVAYCLVSCQDRGQDGPYLATGIRIGDVTQTEAVIWTRLSRNRTRINNGTQPYVFYRDDESGQLVNRSGRQDKVPVVLFEEGVTRELIEGAVPGAPGMVRVQYKPKDEAQWTMTDWVSVDSSKNFTRKFYLDHLETGTHYDVLVEAKPPNEKMVSASLEGGFRTAPGDHNREPVLFGVSTGQGYGHQDTVDGFKIYNRMLELGIDFFVHTGDIVYYDGLAKDKGLALHHWNRTFSLPTNLSFHRQVTSYFIKDDHDTWMNDCWPGRKTRFMGAFTFSEGVQVFLDEMPIKDRTYNTFRWGRDLQIWTVEGRDFRSPNTMPDGPEKTIWGKEQLDWFRKTVSESDATFRVLISPTPVVGPDRTSKKDNHANESFRYEGTILRQFISQQKNMFVVCGDRHWQYVSRDGETGVMEFSCGPASDEHAGGWSNDMRHENHLYLNVIGGFLIVETRMVKEHPVIAFRHYNVDGILQNEYVHPAR